MFVKCINVGGTFIKVCMYLVSSVKGFKRLASEDDDKEGKKGNMSNTLHVKYVHKIATALNC